MVRFRINRTPSSIALDEGVRHIWGVCRSGGWRCFIGYL